MSEFQGGDVEDDDISRPRFLALTSGVAAAPMQGVASAKGDDVTPKPDGRAADSLRASGRHNILFVFTAQERYFKSWPATLSPAGHERLQRSGVSLEN